MSQSQPGTHSRIDCQSKGHEIKTHHPGKRERKSQREGLREGGRRWRDRGGGGKTKDNKDAGEDRAQKASDRKTLQTHRNQKKKNSIHWG